LSTVSRTRLTAQTFDDPLAAGVEFGLETVQRSDDDVTMMDV
jgi:hypothetical protein